jgi:hypothetical protein
MIEAYNILSGRQALSSILKFVVLLESVQLQETAYQSGVKRLNLERVVVAERCSG